MLLGMGSLEVLAWLLDKGAEVDGLSRAGEPPLATAILRGHKHLVAPLLAAGASASLPSTAEVEGEEVQVVSPITAAARWGHADLVRDFLARGADPKATGEDGRTCLEAALLGGDEDLAEALLEAGALISTPLRSALASAVAGECYDFVKRHAAEFSDIGEAAGARQLRSALLSMSVGKPLEAVIDAMVEAGASDTSTEGLYRAVDAGHVGAARAMLEAGADPNAPHFTANKSSLRLHQVLGQSEPKRALVEALLDAGAALDLLDSRGVAPLRYAIW